MKILVITPRFPHPLDKGDKLRAFHQIRLMAENHDIVLCSLSDVPVSRESRDVLNRRCRRVEVLTFTPGQGRRSGLRAMAGGLPYQVGYFTHSDAEHRLRAIVAEENPDLLFFQLVRTAEYARELKVPSLLDYMDAFSCGMAQRAAVGGWWARWAHALEHRFLQRYERRVFDRFSAHTVISDRDCGALPLDRRQGVVVVPNGVDTDVFSPRREDPHWDLLFVGNMAYPPNVRAAHTLVHDIFPKIRHHRPSARLLIAGANPTASVRRLASDGVEISGWVEDIAECYAKSRIFVAPMELGTGMQNKLLQAMAMGLPCVTTPLAAEALAMPEGVIRVVDLQAMDRAVIELLDRPGEAERLGREGHEVVVERFRWESTTNALETALNRAVDRGRFDG